MQAPRSLRHEYEIYLEDEIEAYKESMPRAALLALGDEAVEALRVMPQATLTELVLCEEVDRIIVRRLRLPSYRTWRRRYMARLSELRRPERWGLETEATLVRELVASRDGEHVLVAGIDDEGAVMFPAALGCMVTALDHEPDALGRTIAAAEASGLGRHVRGCVAELDGWMPDAGLRVVLCSTHALSRVDARARGDVIDALQRATLPGGTHFVRVPRSDEPSSAADLSWVEALEPQYAGWLTTFEHVGGSRQTFVARKLAG